MRVLICVDSLGAGGKERQLIELVKGLLRTTAIDCSLCCIDRDVFYLTELASERIPVEVGLRRTRWDVGVFWRLYGAIRRSRPQVIHTLDMISSFYAFPIAKLLGIPLINASIQNAFTRGGFRWKLERFLLKISDYRVANSHAGLHSRGFRLTDRNTVVISNGFDFARIAHALPNADVSHVQMGELKTVGMVAGFSRYKDYPTFIRAARAICARRKDVVFVAVGNGETLAENKELAGTAPIRFLGKRRDVEDIIATFDVGVLSTFTEGISNSVMEYMALRKPVVATDGGGTRELVVDGETGFLVPPRNPEALADRIEYLLDHPREARRMGDAGAARLQREFSIGGMVGTTVKLYEAAARAS